MTATLSLDRPQAGQRPKRTRARSRIGGSAVVSLALHAALLGLAVAWARYHRPIRLVPVDTPATVQLVMSPPGGTPSPGGPPQPKPAPATPKPAPPAPRPAKPVAAAKPQPAKPVAEAKPQAAKPVAAAKPQPAPQPAAINQKAIPAPKATVTAAPQTVTASAAPPTASAAAASPSAPAPQPPPAAPAPTTDSAKLTFNFASVESDTNAFVTGDLVVPPSPDIKFHNRKPSYPSEAVLRGEQGAVVLLIHVSPEGLVSSVDVLRTSGHRDLDRAAEDAVETWHFLPSIRNGRAVPAAMPMRIVFALD